MSIQLKWPKQELGQTKENCERVRKMAETNTKVPPEIKNEIYERRLKGNSTKNTYEWLLQLGYNVHISFISAIYNSIKRDKAQIALDENVDFTHE